MKKTVIHFSLDIQKEHNRWLVIDQQELFTLALHTMFSDFLDTDAKQIN